MNKFYKNYKYNEFDNSLNMLNRFMIKVYNWMSLGLIITSFVSFYIYKCENILYFINCNSKIFFALIIIQFTIVFLLANFIKYLSQNLLVFLFIFYSILTGINLSSLFILYTSSDIFISFFISSFMFIIMTIYGYITKNDLTNFGNLLFMLILGLVLSTLINSYIESELLTWLISYISILLFTGLIAFDTQKLKNLGFILSNSNDSILTNKYSILGALILYIDFINLFLIPLKIMNKKRNKNN